MHEKKDGKRNIYLKLMDVADALAVTRKELDRNLLSRPVVIPAHQACGRVLAAPVYAHCSSPTYHSAAMDGYAVLAEKTFSAREDDPASLVKGRDCHPVNTGNFLPSGMNAVVMIENVIRETDTTIELEMPVFPMQHVRRIGEDIVATELLLPQNREITAYDIGALLSAGIWDVKVWSQVRVHIIPTGDEVLDFTTKPEPGQGQVIESNSQVMAAMARDWGCEVSRVAPVSDNLDVLDKALEAGLASGAQIVIIGAGSSAGSKDFTRQVIERRGKILVHGIKVMPGKPSIMGVVDGRLIVGAPGYPVSTIVCMQELVKELVYWISRRQVPAVPRVEVEVARKVPSKLGMEERVRLSVGRVGSRYVGIPLARGAGMITTLCKAQAVASVPAQSEGLEKGSVVNASLLVPEQELLNTLIVIGSHDNIIDILANELRGLAEPVSIASSHVGSMGGLQALNSGEAMVSGIHLFDPESEDYNFPFLAKYVPGQDITVINLAIRHQGLIVAAGNPKDIKGVMDLTREDVQFVNRQRGAGTRILLDYELKKAGIKGAGVKGYANEEFTHMAVAANVMSGAVDCGLGIHAAAKALELGFIPLARERYDLAIPTQFLKDSRVCKLLELIKSEAFLKKIETAGGYEVTLSGQVMRPGLGLGIS